jgi:hypothetical protein
LANGSANTSRSAQTKVSARSGSKLAAIRRAVEYTLSAADIDQMLRLNKAVNLDFRVQYSDALAGRASPQGGLAVLVAPAGAGRSGYRCEVLQEILTFIAVAAQLQVMRSLGYRRRLRGEVDVLPRRSAKSRNLLRPVAIHIAVMGSGIQSILSFDADFDRWRVERIQPLA